jgi:hypothetical protein
MPDSTLLISFRRIGGVFAAILSLCLLAACQQVGSTTRRGLGELAGAGVGGLVGYEASGHSALGTGAGAAGGALLTHWVQGRDPEVLQEGFDRGYLQGQSDAIKRQYFLRLSSERLPQGGRSEGRPTSYFLPGPTTGPNGEKLQPQLLELRVIE